MTDLQQRLRLRLPACECDALKSEWKHHAPTCIYRLVLEAADALNIRSVLKPIPQDMPDPLFNWAVGQFRQHIGVKETSFANILRALWIEFRYAKFGLPTAVDDTVKTE